MSIYDFTVEDSKLQPKRLKDYRNHVVLIVNTASQCGFTPQYAGLEALYDAFHDQGLEILAFPCNQFGQQEPGSNAEIQAFCQTQYHVTFPVMAKIDVNGTTAHPLYQYLTALEPAGPIAWNFTKFLFDRQGHLIQRYEPAVEPEDLRAVIQHALDAL
ncbi:MAG: glutathione peroxidase [Sulfobacillus thermotolerans]|uniref:Glutathione peroxidase n=1 Tax=Sulfobacillus thermotolerans TaxID=338644 RepID=A0ABM6RVF0_9FIRM|nr:glutathione peroxidase [Sulfobacillus thermotolerans]MCY0906944.1 glutathione peroxidase [Sulfobacillus thermotolerans]